MTDPILSVPTPNGRYYRHPGGHKQVPSITNIKDMLNKPGIPRWAARQAAEYAADNITKLAHLDRDEIVTLVRQSPWTKTEKSPSSIGDNVHDWIDRFAKGEPRESIDAEAANAYMTSRHMWEQFTIFESHYHPQFTMTEFTVWSDTYGYAGTADWAARIGDSLVLGDNKTGKAVYPETGMQLAALAFADYILSPDGEEIELPRFDKYAVLHLRPTFFHLIPVDHIEECFKGFLGLKAAFDLKVNYDDSILGYAPKIGTRGQSNAA